MLCMYYHIVVYYLQEDSHYGASLPQQQTFGHYTGTVYIISLYMCMYVIVVDILPYHDMCYNTDHTRTLYDML